jgi:hypothetical protein
VTIVRSASSERPYRSPAASAKGAGNRLAAVAETYTSGAWIVKPGEEESFRPSTLELVTVVE